MGQNQHLEPGFVYWFVLVFCYFNLVHFRRDTYPWIILAAIYPIPAYTAPANTVPPDYDINNTTVSYTDFWFLWFPFSMLLLHPFALQIFVGNLDLNVTEEELKQIFLQFGEIVSVKIHAGKGFGFVQYGTRSSFFPLLLSIWFFCGTFWN